MDNKATEGTPNLMHGRDRNVLGGARFAGPEDVPELDPKVHVEGRKIDFGYVVDRPSSVISKRLLTTEPQKHYLSFAPTRSGKGACLIIPNLVYYNGPCVVIDPKGENAWATAAYRGEGPGRHQKIYIVDPWGEVKRRFQDPCNEQGLPYKVYSPVDYNPLSILDPQSEHYSEDLAYLADALIINEGHDPHWDNSARELVAGLLAFLVEKHPEAAHLGSLRVLLTKSPSEICGIAESAQSLGFESVAARKLGRFRQESREIAGIISTAVTQTAFLDSKTLCESMWGGEDIFSALLSPEGATIYLVLPVDKLQTYGRWLRIMVSIAIRTVARHPKRLPRPVLFMLDEFGTIGRLSAVAQAFGLMAGLNMCLWPFCQDINQLIRDYPKEWETFIGNSDFITFSSVLDQKTAEYLSRALGTTTRHEKAMTVSFSDSVNISSSDTSSRGTNRSDNVTINTYARALVLPEEVRLFPENYFVILKRGLPFITYIYPYFKSAYLMNYTYPNPNYELSMEAEKLMKKGFKPTDILNKFYNNIPLPGEEPAEEVRRVLTDEEIRALALQKITDYAAAAAFVRWAGGDVKKKGLFGVLMSNGKTEKAFKNKDSFIDFIRQYFIKNCNKQGLDAFLK